jgi:predicted transcriptional regulator of viral defense system
MQYMATTTQSRLASIAADQWGLVTRRQAEGAGVSATTFRRLASSGRLERLAHGVYHLPGAPTPDHPDLRAAWLQLEPEIPAWQRTPEQGVASHRSAASLYGLGELPADRHEFTLPVRRQSRRADVRLHHRSVGSEQWIWLNGLPVTRPARIVSDLLWDREDPTAVAQLLAEAARQNLDHPGRFAAELRPHAAHFGLRRGDGLALLRWLLDLVDDPDAQRYLAQVRQSLDRDGAEQGD